MFKLMIQIVLPLELDVLNLQILPLMVNADAILVRTSKLILMVHAFAMTIMASMVMIRLNA